MEMEVRFPGNKRVNAHGQKFVIETDQPKEDGGDESAPEPFALFMASMATCAGIYVVYFCEERKIDTTGLKMSVAFEQDEKTHLVTQVRMRIDLPPDFPPKYRKAVCKAAGMCTVKRNLAAPPQFSIEAVLPDD